MNMFFLIADLVYNNTKNININSIFFEFNCKYYSYIFYKKDLNLCLKLKTVKEFFLSSKN